jgi:trehalose 6-phosphate synthase/phosphatase
MVRFATFRMCLLTQERALGIRSSGRDIQELHDYIIQLVERINTKHGHPGYQPIVLIARSVPLHEKIAMYSIADCAVVTATRDGMNLVPYEYIVCRKGVPVRPRIGVAGGGVVSKYLQVFVPP